jgi:hypothetical protein
VNRRQARFTKNPETEAPRLRCPACDAELAYVQTIYNGVNPVERWDWLECATCGVFEYRHRTRKLRHSDGDQR